MDVYGSTWGKTVIKITRVEPQLPEDVIAEILKCLPVKTLLRFKCVSKNWFELIKSSNFVKNHLLNQLRVNPRLLVLSGSTPASHKEGPLYFKEPELQVDCDVVRPDINIPFMKYYIESIHKYPDFIEDIRVLGPCNGLVCIAYYEYFMLCNPALREFKELTSCPVVYPPNVVILFPRHGFGITADGDYKVVLLSSFHDRLTNEYKSQGYVYNLSTSLWAKVNDCPKATTLPIFRRDPVFFNGICHWHVFFNNCISLLSFNLNTEKFLELEYPGCIREYNTVNMTPFLMVINKCLGFIGMGSSQLPTEVWVMKNYGVTESWTKQFSLGSNPLISADIAWKDGQWSRDELLSRELNSMELTRSIYQSDDSSHALVYKESLISLDEVMNSAVRMR